MTKTKIQGKFYPLQHDEWLRACRELTPAQRDVLYFVRTLDPYGEGLDISIAEIARQLSTDKRTVHRSTVSRALKELDANGFIDMELLMVKLNIKAKGIHCWDSEVCTLPFENASGVQDASLRATQGASETSVLPTDNKRDHDATVLPTDNKRDHDATSVITTQQA
jgi:predicted transcriptional regulator